MSASDAAPLPRLGEVFFDVRGNSRSMRLSWYADTGVAVFSIWQGGMCTGTFRLAIADLPRMVQTLQRGPDGQQPGWDGEAPGQAFADAPGDATAQVRAMGPMSGQMMQPAPADFRDDGTGGPGVPGGPGGPGSPDQGQYRNETTGYLAEPLDHLNQPADPGAGSGPAGYPGEPQPPNHRGGAPDYVADPIDALGQLGVPEAPAPYQAAAREYLAETPSEQRPRPADYLTGPPPEQHAAPPDYRTGPPPQQQPGPPGYPTGPPPHQQPGPPDYRSGPPPGERPQPADYLTGPPPHQQAGPPEYLTASSGRPGGAPEQPPEYLAELPGVPNADRGGYGGDFHAGGGAATSYPGVGESGDYPQDSAGQAAYPDEPVNDPYLAGTGSMDYQGEAPVSHYSRGSSAPRSASRSARRPAPRSPGQADGPGPATADYPVHYGTAVTDDSDDEPPVESFPYQPRRGRR